MTTTFGSPAMLIGMRPTLSQLERRLENIGNKLCDPQVPEKEKEALVEQEEQVLEDIRTIRARLNKLKALTS